MGCRNEDRAQELRLSTVEDSPDLSHLKAGPPFQAQLVEIHIILETNNTTSAPSNFYQFVLREGNGQERVFAGFNASDSDLHTLRILQKSNLYSFPEVFEKSPNEPSFP